jgi:amidase
MSNGHSSAEDLGDTIDVILCPAGPGVAPPLDCAKYWGYTSLWNLLDWPALVFPVSDGHVKADDDLVLIVS